MIFRMHLKVFMVIITVESPIRVCEADVKTKRMRGVMVLGVGMGKERGWLRQDRCLDFYTAFVPLRTPK
jgi:hypothetical protein